MRLCEQTLINPLVGGLHGISMSWRVWPDLQSSSDCVYVCVYVCLSFAIYLYKLSLSNHLDSIVWHFIKIYGDGDGDCDGFASSEASVERSIDVTGGFGSSDTSGGRI